MNAGAICLSHWGFIQAKMETGGMIVSLRLAPSFCQGFNSKGFAFPRFKW